MSALCRAPSFAPLKLAIMPSAALALILASAHPAHADVMEIGSRGAVWVSGGPAAASSFAPARADPDSPAGASAVTAAVTAVEPTAGPEAWRGHVGVLAARYDISPALLEALVWQESRWNVAAVSPAGARGLAQLMPGTSRQLGVDWRDPLANLEGGARYLRQQLDRFDGDVEKALAAYNAGPGRVERARGIPAIRETQHYVAAIMARLAQPVRR